MSTDQLYELSLDVGAALKRRQYPWPVSYAEILQREGFTSAIVFDRDQDAGDVPPMAPNGVQQNPRKVRARRLGCMVRIYHQSTVPGARVVEHRAECDAIVDALFVCLDEWGTAARAGDLPVSRSRYLRKDELNGIETFPGVVYEIRFGLPRAVLDKTFDGMARPEAAPAKVANRTDVSQVAVPSNVTPPVTGCDSMP